MVIGYMSKYFTIIANFIKLISYLKFVDFLTGNGRRGNDLNVQVYEIFHHLFTDFASLHVISIEFYG